jgi:hypothetical protein
VPLGSHAAALVVIGWGTGRLRLARPRREPDDDLARSVPRYFLVFKDRGLDPESVLVPTAGGPDSESSAGPNSTDRRSSRRESATERPTRPR